MTHDEFWSRTNAVRWSDSKPLEDDETYQIDNIDIKTQAGYSTGKWSDDDDVHPTITPIFGPNR